MEREDSVENTETETCAVILKETETETKIEY